MLEVRALTARYGASRVLFGIDFDLCAGRVLTLLGRNGAGRTTVARALVGRVARGGSVRLLGRELVAERPFRIARAGIAYVPENREVFGQLNVEENLRLGQQPAAPAHSTALVSGSLLCAVPRACRSAAWRRPVRCRAASSRCWCCAAR
jgi:branched-chain amino acid transport system ATP-binding protein